MTQILFTGIFILGTMFVLAGRGSEGIKKRNYYLIAAGLWVLILVLANVLL
jgi:hypothetical protein